MPDILLDIDDSAFIKDLERINTRLSELKKKVDRALPKMTYRTAAVIWEAIVDVISEKDIVLTGTLRRSVHVAAPGVDHSGDIEKAKKRKITRRIAEAVLVKALTAETEIGTWLDYSYLIERGTRKMKARPYMLPGFERSKDDAKQQWFDELKDILEL
jgi:HK97 gp10 family phage protein